MSAGELVEWQAFDAIEPIGEVRADLRAALIASTFANVMRGKRPAAPLSDFLLFKDAWREVGPRSQEVIAEEVKTVFGNLMRKSTAKAQADESRRQKQPEPEG